MGPTNTCELTCHEMETFRNESCARGYHIYMYEEQWDAAIGEELEYQHERGNAATLKIFNFDLCRVLDENLLMPRNVQSAVFCDAIQIHNTVMLCYYMYIVYCSALLYSWKYWRSLNLAVWSRAAKIINIGGFKFGGSFVHIICAHTHT